MATINYDVDKTLLYYGFNSSFNQKYIAEDVFDSYKEIMSLTEKYISNISKGFSESISSNRKIIFRLR